MLMLLDITKRKRKHDIRKVRDCIRPNSEERDIENEHRYVLFF